MLKLAVESNGYGPKWPILADFGGFLVGSRLLGMVMGSELVQSVPSTSPDMCGVV